MALRLAHLLGTTPESWLNMQMTLDIWHLEQRHKNTYKQIEKFA